jgi:hypothetical protein
MARAFSALDELRQKSVGHHHTLPVRARTLY